MRMAVEIILVRVSRLQEIRMREEPVAIGHEPVVVGSGHAHIHVIVPRYESMVSDGAEQRAAIDPEAQFFFSAHLGEDRQQVGFHSPHLFHLCQDMESVSHLLLKIEVDHLL